MIHQALRTLLNLIFTIIFIAFKPINTLAIATFNLKKAHPLAHLLLLGIIYVSFISLGLPDGVMGVAWPAVRVDMGQPLAAVGVFTLVGTVCAAVSSYFAGAIVKRVGTGAVVAASCLMTALALVGYGYAPSFAWLVALSIPMGIGAGAVDTSLNHFVASHYSSRHMNWLHGFWGVGATLGPLIMSWAGCQLARQPQAGAIGNLCGSPGRSAVCSAWLGG